MTADCGDTSIRTSSTQRATELLAIESLIQRDVAVAQTIKAVQQPPSHVVSLISEELRADHTNVLAPADYPEGHIVYANKDCVFKNNLPFYNYYALKSTGSFVIHPMRLGRFLIENAASPIISTFMEAAIKIAHELPNGGLAWYYPRCYSVSRMLGSHLKYSSISQGTLLAGFTKIGRLNPQIGFSLARKVFLAMLWPFELGGVNFADRAVLEMPSYSGPPENILNGWIDALLHISDYVADTQDDDAKGFLYRNLAFLAEPLQNFDVPEHQLSRYSDLSPYRIKVTVDNPKHIETLRVLYKSKRNDIQSILIPLHYADGAISPYENQIIRQNGRVAFAWISHSQLYQTIIMSSSPTMKIVLRSGRVQPDRSAPGLDGDMIELCSAPLGDGSMISLEDVSSDLIAGYPTNFLKDRKFNYYHVYHFVSLMILGLEANVSPRLKQTLLDHAIRWYRYSERPRREDVEFYNATEILRRINALRSNAVRHDFSALLAEAIEATAA